MTRQKLTPAQYRQIQEQSYPRMTVQDEAIHAGMVTRHRPAHNFPVGMSFAEMQAEMEDMLRPTVKEVTQLKFTVAALDAMVKEQRSIIENLVDRLEYAEMVRNLESNKRKVEE